MWKGDTSAAGSRYLTAATAYEKAGLYKNGIAVCKKMMRLSLSASPVLQRLGLNAFEFGAHGRTVAAPG